MPVCFPAHLRQSPTLRQLRLSLVTLASGHRALQQRVSVPLVLLLLAHLLSGTAGSAAAAEPTGDQASAPPQGRTYQVMTYNIRYLNQNDGPDHWKHRASTVAEVIGTADVIGLQEATRAQIDDLLPQLPQLDWYGVGRSDGRDGGEFSPVFWRKDRFEAIDQGTFWLGPDPQAVGQPAWGARLPRICSWVILRLKDTADTAKRDEAPPEWLVMNTHFDHQSGEARLRSAGLMREQAARLAQGRPVIVMGDLNAGPDSPPLVAMTAADEKLALVDTRTRSETPPQGPSGTWNGFRQINPDTRIDFILTTADRPRVLAHRTEDPKTPAGRFASDHLPVAVTLQP